MNQADIEALTALAKVLLQNNMGINTIITTPYYDYEIVTYFDEVVVLDSDETVLLSVKKENEEKET